MATGADPGLDPEAVDAVAEWYADREELYRSAGIVAARGPESATDAQSRLIAAFGRDPGWSPVGTLASQLLPPAP